jgi:hypothetical protein
VSTLGKVPKMRCKLPTRGEVAVKSKYISCLIEASILCIKFI